MLIECSLALRDTLSIRLCRKSWRPQRQSKTKREYPYYVVTESSAYAKQPCLAGSGYRKSSCGIFSTAKWRRDLPTMSKRPGINNRHLSNGRTETRFLPEQKVYTITRGISAPYNMAPKYLRGCRCSCANAVWCQVSALGACQVRSPGMIVPSRTHFGEWCLLISLGLDLK